MRQADRPGVELCPFCEAETMATPAAAARAAGAAVRRRQPTEAAELASEPGCAAP